MLSINFWNILFTVINVLVIYWILDKLLFKRVMKVVTERKNDIKEKYDEVRRREEDAHKEKIKYMKKQDAAEEEAAKIIRNARIEADRIHDKRIADAAEEADKIRAKARVDAENTKQRNLDESREAISALAMMAAKKILENGGEADAAGKNS
ncbi:MAG: ATP synthase F0 subunit B [Lachnospiraceae bacterium]|nr:ATP synthase F0 subunit B [Lachnospiraceae bacterium]MDD7326924.1 ATP synthase F0 subunit B [Lachnospiraceae bacterium]MDY2760142.1 ATP synthase F0 subunit B [Lachnospiraceae bacterium]